MEIKISPLIPRLLLYIYLVCLNLFALVTLSFMLLFMLLEFITLQFEPTTVPWGTILTSATAILTHSFLLIKLDTIHSEQKIALLLSIVAASINVAIPLGLIIKTGIDGFLHAETILFLGYFIAMNTLILCVVGIPQVYLKIFPKKKDPA